MSTIIKVSPNAGVQGAAELRHKLLGELQAHGQITVDLESAPGLDVPTAQLLIAAERMALRDGKSISLTGLSERDRATFGLGHAGRAVSQ